ncbi:MAG: hypothetical protein HKL80_06315 [Acidimicrobiales bacterium]|nr:hypothetical protein [Acidimicrobiales bacterium]
MHGLCERSTIEDVEAQPNGSGGFSDGDAASQLDIESLLEQALGNMPGGAAPTPAPNAPVANRPANHALDQLAALQKDLDRVISTTSNGNGALNGKSTPMSVIPPSPPPPVMPPPPAATPAPNLTASDIPPPPVSVMPEPPAPVAPIPQVVSEEVVSQVVPPPPPVVVAAAKNQVKYDFPNKVVPQTHETQSDESDADRYGVFAIASQASVDDLLAAEFGFDDEPVAPVEAVAAPLPQIVPPPPVMAKAEIAPEPAPLVPPPPRMAPQAVPPAPPMAPQSVPPPPRMAPQPVAAQSSQGNTAVSVEVTANQVFGADYKYIENQRMEAEAQAQVAAEQAPASAPVPEFRSQSFVIKASNKKGRTKK